MRTMLVKKQSQFPAGKIPHHSTIPFATLSCETKPIVGMPRGPWTNSVRKTH